MMVCWMNQIEELNIGVLDESNWIIKQCWCVGWIKLYNYRMTVCVGWIKLYNYRMTVCVGGIKLYNYGMMVWWMNQIENVSVVDSNQIHAVVDHKRHQTVQPQSVGVVENMKHFFHRRLKLWSTSIKFVCVCLKFFTTFEQFDIGCFAIQHISLWSELYFLFQCWKCTKSTKHQT